MAKEFLLPELAESVVEGEIVSWLADEGSFVEEDQPLLEVMTDKATVEIPSPYRGVLEKHLAKVGDVVEVHKPVAVFADAATDAVAEGLSSGSSLSSSPGSMVIGSTMSESTTSESTMTESSAASQDASQLSRRNGSVTSPQTATAKASNQPAATQAASTSDTSNASVASDTSDNGGVFFAPIRNDDEAPLRIQRQRHKRVLAAPAARKLAREHQLDLHDVAGSGPNGRIRVADVRKHLDNQSQATANLLHMPNTPRQVSEAYRDLEERTPMRGLRRTIAKQMVASHLQTVRTLLVDEADVSRLVALRGMLKPRAEARGVKLSYLPFIMKAVVSALQAFPMMNASLDTHHDETQHDEIVMRRYYNFGLAVATDVGLLVPVIKDVDKKSLLTLASELHAVAERARSGKLNPDDVRDGTFSITNIGSYSGLFSFPIINVDSSGHFGGSPHQKAPGGARG